MVRLIYAILAISLFLTSSVCAAPYYIWIKKKSDRSFTRGDVVSILPATEANRPTANEAANYIIIKVDDMTQADLNALFEMDVDDVTQTVVKPRKFKINIDTFSDTRPETEIKGNEVRSKITAKPAGPDPVVITPSR